MRRVPVPPRPHILVSQGPDHCPSTRPRLEQFSANQISAPPVAAIEAPVPTNVNNPQYGLEAPHAPQAVIPIYSPVPHPDSSFPRKHHKQVILFSL